MSRERALNLDRRKLHSENYNPMKVWLQFVYKITETYCRSRHFVEFTQTQGYPISFDKIPALT